MRTSGGRPAASRSQLSIRLSAGLYGSTETGRSFIQIYDASSHVRIRSGPGTPPSARW